MALEILKKIWHRDRGSEQTESVKLAIVYSTKQNQSKLNYKIHIYIFHSFISFNDFSVLL
jgi:hypothetical protein